jgi:hypothetical protein
MTIFDEKINALVNFQSSINETVADEIAENKHIIIDMVATAQLFESGIDGRGMRLDSFSPYTARTISIKRSKGQVVDRVTLRDTGDFQDSINVFLFDGGFLIVGEDKKTKELMDKYGDDILSLTDEHIGEIIWDYLYPALSTKLESLL